MNLFKWLPKLLVLPTTMATVIGLIRGHVPAPVLWMLIGAFGMILLLLVVSPGLRSNGKAFIFWIPKTLDRLQGRIFRVVRGKNKADIVRIRQQIDVLGGEAQEAKLHGNEASYISLRDSIRCMTRAIEALQKNLADAAKKYEEAAEYHTNDNRCVLEVSGINQNAHRQVKWLWQAASHNWGNAAHFQTKVALAVEEKQQAQAATNQKRVVRYKKAAGLYEEAARAYGEEDFKLASSLEEKAEETASEAKKLDNGS